MQAAIRTMIARDGFLQKLAIGVGLDRQQRRHVEHDGTLAEILADALLFGEGITHGEHHLGFA
jgi:hypothetical protein